MTPQEVKDLIESQITDNGSNLITAAVLRPVLIAMVDQINDLVGNGGDLPETKTVIETLNDIQPQGLVVHTGDDDPTVMPPPDFNNGDFYQQVIGGSTVGFWQFMGDTWINIYNISEE